MTDVDARQGAFLRELGRPKPSPAGPVDLCRVLLSAGAVAAGVMAVVWVVRLLPDWGALSVAVTVLLGLAVLPVVASVLEWFVHRFVYHEAVIQPLGAIFTVHTAHHFAYFPTWRYVTGGPARRLSIRKRSPEAYVSPMRNARVRLAHFSWYMAIGAVVVWMPAWLATGDVPFLVGLMISTAVVSNLFIVVHDNLNFLLPLGDLLFGTLRTEMTPEELDLHGPLELAKARPVGEGERARARRSSEDAVRGPATT
jgi:hypothetical protein